MGDCQAAGYKSNRTRTGKELTTIATEVEQFLTSEEKGKIVNMTKDELGEQLDNMEVKNAEFSSALDKAAQATQNLLEYYESKNDDANTEALNQSIEGERVKQRFIENMHRQLVAFQTRMEKKYNAMVKVELQPVAQNDDEPPLTQRQMFEMMTTNIGGLLREQRAERVAEAAANSDRAKLPKFEIPKFSGNVLEWHGFWAQFSSSIDSKRNLPPIEKLTYLRSYLTGEALKLVDAYTFTEANYPIVVAFLKDRYGKDDKIIESHFKALKHLPPATTNPQKLRCFYDTMEQHLQSLEGLHQDVENFMMVATIKDKLSEDTLQKMEMFKPETDKWTVKLIRKYLKRIVQMSEDLCDSLKTQASFQFDGSTFDGSTSKPKNPQNTSKPPRPSASALVTFERNSQQGAQQSRPKTCVYCEKPHWSDECRKFATSEVRKKKLYDDNRCINCTSNTHKTKECKSKRPCTHCKKTGHHRSLCFKMFKGSTQEPRQKGGSNRNGPNSGLLSQSNASDIDEDDEEKEKDLASKPKTKTQFLNIPTNGSSLLVKDQSTIMRTATVKVLHPENPEGQKSTVSAIFDTGSSSSYLVLHVAKELHLDKGNTEEIPTATFGSEKTQTTTMVLSEVLVELQDGSHMKMSVRVIERIAAPIYQLPYGKLLPPDVLKEFQSLPKADKIPFKEKHRSYQLLIGNDYYENFMSLGKMELIPGLIFQNTKLGWIITGRIEDTGPKMPTPSLFVHSYFSRPQPEVSFLVVPDSAIPSSPDMKMFWDVETLGIEPPSDKTEDEQAVQQFNDTVRVVDGRYEVTWPKKVANPDLPDNYALAYHRLNSQCKRFKEKPELLKKGDEIIKKQIEAGIIEAVTSDTEEGPLKHYIPHHMVETPDKHTTKCRMVFDASARKNKHSLSLNDCLYPGPPLIQDLVGLILRFRLPLIAIVADIEKAFLNIGLQIPDRDVTRFFWFKDPDKPSVTDNIQVYRFCRIPFGVNSSPFLLASTVNHLLESYGTPVALQLREDIYVDNVITGAPDVESAMKLFEESQTIFQKVNLNLREWSSNSGEFLEKIPSEKRAEGTIVKVLGIQWNTAEDTLTITGFDKQKFQHVAMKREVLQALASVYDPMGYFTPVTLMAKLFLCRLWVEKYNWDQKLPADKLVEWKEIYTLLSDISTYSIPRFIGNPFNPDVTYQLICFCDASATSYATTVYLRSCLDDICLVNLQLSKSRLAPPKKVWSIPRLELMAAVIGNRSMDSVEEWLHLPITSKTLWSDSQCVLHWIKSAKKLSVFVENRVKEIRKSEDITYRYVHTTSNPADLATRGRSVQELHESFWWHGPPWLTQPEDTWPSWDVESFDQATIDAIDVEYRKNAKVIYEATLLVGEGPLEKEMSTPYGIKRQNSSSLRKLLRVTAFCTRFIANCISRLKWRHRLHKRYQSVVKLPHLSAQEITEANLWWNQVVQQHWFADVITSMQRGKKPKFSLQLGLQMDKKGLLRCHGRFENAGYTEAAKQPILLPTKDYYTKLVIESYHESALHSGVSQTLAMVRQQYWIPQGRSRVRLVLLDCRECRRKMGGPYKLPDMASWPKEKMTESPPFTVTGLDYFGPLYIKDDQGLEKKVWVCLFTCVAVRAVHLELVYDMSSEEFIRCFRRFIAVHGKPEQLISDNATQFKLAKTTIQQAWDNIVYDADAQNYVASNGITWKFIIQFAPWTGGFYERMVGIVKSSLKKSIGNLHLNASQLSTILAEAQAVVNSRPLVFVHEDVNSESALTPGHFLGLNPKVGVPTLSQETDDVDPDFNYLPESSADSLIRTWKTGQKHLEQFWKAWRNNYLLSLRERNQHRVVQGRIQSANTIKIGDVVLIKDNLPRGSWKLGKVKLLITSTDGAIRAANVMLPSKRTLNRPINLLYPIECPSALSVSGDDQTAHVTATSGDQPNTPQATNPSSRPKRTAAIRGRQTVQHWIKDMVGLNLEDKCRSSFEPG